MTSETAYDTDLARAPSAWSAVFCLSLLTFVLVASEFMPVSLLTPIAADLGISEGQAGQAISISGIFAVLTSLFGNVLLARFDRRTVVLIYTGLLVASGLTVTFAPNYFLFMVGRALIGISIGGFWSLSTAILARVVVSEDLPKAIAMLQGGTAFASVIAAPLGSFLGGIVGWRGAFFIVVPIGVLAMTWQLAVLPRMPAREATSVGRMFALLNNRVFALGMAATTLAFMGQFSVYTYLRPFLENVTGLKVTTLSAALLALGLAGLVGTSVVGFALRSRLGAVLVGLPAMLAVIAVLLIVLGPYSIPVAGLLILWGLLTTPIPVSWNTWMTRVIPGDLEAGGGLQVALIQFAITFGAFGGGLLYDGAGWWAPFVLGACLLGGSAMLALSAAASLRRGHP
ncbi:MFS transporter [Neorhizobium sp. 2083]|uniref:MFS transporter n=1 Tax=Neorhizobium sp. 2083 TaxID=2817762 RepID=UPI00286BC557|nr:MFS transporter [Neorhizobium sp. 2083]